MNEKAAKPYENLQDKKDKNYVALYSYGELIGFFATYEKKLHRDEELKLTSFTDVTGNYIEWNGETLFSKEPIKINDKPEMVYSR